VTDVPFTTPRGVLCVKATTINLLDAFSFSLLRTLPSSLKFSSYEPPSIEAGQRRRLSPALARVVDRILCPASNLGSYAPLPNTRTRKHLRKKSTLRNKARDVSLVTPGPSPSLLPGTSP